MRAMFVVILGLACLLACVRPVGAVSVPAAPPADPCARVVHLYWLTHPEYGPEEELARFIRRGSLAAHCAPLADELEAIQRLPEEQRREREWSAFDKANWSTTSHPEPMVTGLGIGRTPHWMLQDWFSALLIAMKEPRLSSATPRETYRLLLATSFSNRPVVVRIERTDGATSLTERALENPYAAGPPRDDWTRALTEEEWRDFVPLTSFLPSAPQWRGPKGSDGTMWVLESVREGEYHLIVRWCPEDSAEEAEIATLGRKMLELAHLPPDRSYY